MAIRLKGLEYFPLDVDFFENEKIAIIISDFGFEASAVVLKLLGRIYKNGFYLKWDEKACKIFTNSFRSRYSSAEIQRIVDALLEECFFDSRMYEEFGILTSLTIQQCFFVAARRRQNKHIEHGEFLLVDLGEKDSCRQNAATSRANVVKKPENVCKNGKNDDIPEQSKVEESKANNESECARATARASFAEWKKELLADEDWRASAVRQSGQGVAFNATLPRRLDDFCDWLVSTSEEATVRTRADFTRRFHYWWQYHGRKQEAEPPRQDNKPKSKLEEINRAGDEALTLARQMLLAG